MFSSCEVYSASIFSLLEADRLVFSSCEARLMDERTRKKAEIPAFSTKNGEPGGTRTHDTKLKRLVLLLSFFATLTDTE